MKNLVIVFIVFGICVVSSENLGDAISQFLEKLKKSIHCGLPDGKSLNPFVLANNDDHFIYDYESPDFIFNVNLTKFIVTGADTFKVVTSKYNEDDQEYELDLMTPDATFDLQYGYRFKLNSSYLFFNIINTGSYLLEMKPSSFQLKFNLGTGPDGELVAEKLKIVESFSSQIGNYNYGPELQKEIDSVFAQKDDHIDYAMETFLLPKLNQVLREFKSVDELTEQIKQTAENSNQIFGTADC